MADEANTGPPIDANEGGKNGGGLAGHFKKHAAIYMIGIGGATLVVAVIAMKGNSSQSDSSQTGVGYKMNNPNVGTTDTMGGSSADINSLNSMVQGLTSIESQNYNLLQQIANGMQPKPAPAPTPAPTPTPKPKPKPLPKPKPKPKPLPTPKPKPKPIVPVHPVGPMPPVRMRPPIVPIHPIKQVHMGAPHMMH